MPYMYVYITYIHNKFHIYNKLYIYKTYVYMILLKKTNYIYHYLFIYYQKLSETGITPENANGFDESHGLGAGPPHVQQFKLLRRPLVAVRVGVVSVLEKVVTNQFARCVRKMDRKWIENECK